MNTIAKRISNNVQKYPQKIAIVDHDGTRETTWAELLEVATKIACHARREGLSGIVPILQGRTMEYVASILGLNMAGIAVVNLTDSYPEERVNYICEDVGASGCVNSTFVERAMSFPVEPFDPCGNASDIAMLLYTSGSTGIPKGVVYDNNCLLHSIERNIRETELDHSAVYSSVASFSFVAVQFDLLTSLAAGATLHILSENCRKDIEQLTQYLNARQITHSVIPFRLLQRIYAPLSSMKLVVTGSEKVSDIIPQTYRIINCYAMSETTTYVTYFTLDKAYDNTPIGKPACGMSIYLLDENGNLCNEGEICIAGPIARGYWNRPELTEKNFVSNPFATGEHDKVLLHTGDIAKRLPDGNLLYLNRKDWMVKISGQRVEPGEIEAVMQQLPEVKQAVVKGFVNPQGQTYLCGFYTVNSPISDENIRAFLSDKLPSYMLPRFLVQLDNFPLNSNGKLDRLSLNAPEAAEFQGEYAAPEIPEEALLCHAFERVLGTKPVGVFDDFFRMGGDSLSVMNLMVEAEQLHLKPEYVFTGKSPRGIAALIQKDSTAQMDIYTDCEEVRTFYPLTSSQRIILRTYLEAPWSTAFNCASVYSFPLDADAKRIREALLAVFTHYPVLSMKIEEHDGIYGMVKRSDMKLHIPILEIQECELALKKREFVTPFNPAEDLLIRAQLYRTEKQIYLFWDVYHMIMDGSSVTLFFKQFVRAYYGEALITEQLTQFHLSNYEEKYLKSELLQQAGDYFTQKLDGHIFPSEPAFDYPEYAGGVRESRCIFRSLSEQTLTDKLDQFVSANGITVATFLMSAFADTLRKMTQNEQVYFVSIESGRHNPCVQNTLGQLLKYIPITVSFDQETTDIELMRKIQTEFIESWSYDDFPFGLLESEFGISNSIVHLYQGESQTGFHLSDQFVPMEFLVPNSCASNLLVCVWKRDKIYEFNVVYNMHAYKKDTIENVAEAYVETIYEFLQ